MLTAGQKFSENRDLHHKMFDEVQDYAILLINEEGIVQTWNKGAEKIKGYKAEEIIGKNFSLFYPEEDRAGNLPGKLINEAIKKGRATHEGWRIRKDGTRFWGSIVITAIHDDDGGILGFVKVTRDLTEKKLAEDELKLSAIRLAEKNKELEKSNKELEQFAYAASHDLQEPLRKIRTYSGILHDNLKDKIDAASIDTLQKVINATKRMSALINDLLNFSRLSETKKKFDPTDLNKVIQNVISDCELIIEEKNADIQINALPVIEAVPLQMSQLFFNLLSNSLKFSKKNHPPVITIKSTPLAQEEIEKRKNLNPALSYFDISISDNGIGFDPQYAEDIFEAFKRLQNRTHYPGSGIGLALCRKITLSHQGDIYAEGIEGQGAVFHVILPSRQ